MFEKILVPLDGSPLAEIVIPYLKALSSKADISATFLHVCRDNALHLCEAYVKHVAGEAEKQLKGTRGVASAVAESGNVATRILEEATRQKASMILMAAHGTSGKGPWTLGSVTHKVVTTSHLPVLIVREELAETAVAWPQDIVVALDGSELSESVLPHVLEMARAGAKVTLLRVCEPPMVLADYPDAQMPEDWDKHFALAQNGAEKACAVYLEEVGAERLKKQGVAASTQVILSERAAEGIIQFVNKDPSALIVMSTHGRSGITRFPFGHVADRVLLACKNPILLLRPKR